MVVPFICGIDKNGNLLAIDLHEEAHLLLSSETGGGKSTLLRAVITTLIQLKEPDDLEIHLGDLKRAEMGMFRNKKCVKGVYTRKEEIKKALNEIQKEMKRRGDLLDKHELNHISELPEKLPSILVCIDEVALLKKEQKIMDIIEEISAIGRALQIHLVLSMQRPDAKILDGALKNNLRVRISGRQSNAVNAKVAGVIGTEKIGMEQRGRMKIKLDDIQDFQAPLLTNEKAKKILIKYRIELNIEEEDIEENPPVEQQEEQIEDDIEWGFLDNEPEPKG